jgi:predicted metal-binding membrane protein
VATAARSDARRGTDLAVPAVVATALLAWLALWWWGTSPSLHLVHAHPGHAGPPAPGNAAAAIAFVGGWTTMTVAMMLPTTVPLVALFGAVVRERSDRALLHGLVCAGYLAAWTLAGAGAFALTIALRHGLAGLAWARSLPWIVPSASCLLAGLFQFSRLKHACLSKCRSPFSFIVEHWTGTRERRQAFRLGVHHGVFCVGCCWALMLLMIPFGAGNLGWMLALAAIMAAEKNATWGAAAARPIGVALIALAGVLALRGALA